MSDPNRLFQHAVLQGLWLIVLLLSGKHASLQRAYFRSNCLGFGDLFGQQTDEAKQYRRNVTYWWEDDR